MKKYFFTGIIIALLTGCNNNTVTEEKKVSNAAHETHYSDTVTSSMDSIKALKAKYASLQFASKRDTICGMPVTAGVVDTLMLGEKIYGFCATGCKDEFAKILVTEGKRK